MANASTNLNSVADTIRNGGVIAYPTEAVYGLGCDPLNADSVFRLLVLKQRDPKKGLILIAADIQQLEPFIKPLTADQMARVTATWPGPVTWIFPATTNTPEWLTGYRDTLAVRVTKHPVAAAICQAYGGAIVSTSANLTGHEPARSKDAVHEQFGDELDIIVSGNVDTQTAPTPIYDAITGKQVRK